MVTHQPLLKKLLCSLPSSLMLGLLDKLSIWRVQTKWNCVFGMLLYRSTKNPGQIGIQLSKANNGCLI